MPTVYLGFTGRADGLTPGQKKSLREMLGAHLRHCVVVHNDGEGADKEFALLAAELGFKVEVTRNDLSPIPRNRELVAACSKLFAAPPTDFLLKRGSGSWETVKYAWKAHKPTFIVLSDGSVVQDREKLPVSP